MADLWFDDGVDRRDTGPKSKFRRKPPRLQGAIILAANKCRVDIWELVAREAQAEFLEQAARLLSEDVAIEREDVRGRGPGLQ